MSRLIQTGNSLHGGIHQAIVSLLVAIVSFFCLFKFRYVVLCFQILVVGQYLVQAGKSKAAVKAASFAVTYKRQLPPESQKAPSCCGWNYLQ